MSDDMIELSIILPCLDEEKVLGFCLDKIKKIIKTNRLEAEIIVVDNGSVDKSCNIAQERGARLIHEEKIGYGSAYLKGFETAKGKYIFLSDSDGTYDFNEITKFINELKKGYDFVIGNRFQGKIEKCAMPWAHRYIGNPVLSGILRLFFRIKINDAHCGMRAITKEALKKLHLKTTGMEFASEMIVMAAKNRLKIKEVPINYYKRLGRSKLQPLADGWRHLRFMLLYSPLFLFFVPGAILFLLGIGLTLWLYFGPPEIFGIKIYFHPMFFASLSIITGYQLMGFALFAKTYSITHLDDEPVFDKFYKYATIDKASVFGMLMVLLGSSIYLMICIKWIKTGFGVLTEVKNSILALTLIIIGIQTIFSSFMLSILGIKQK